MIRPGVETLFDPAEPVSIIMRWLDYHNGRSHAETGLRILKLSEEYGETIDAWMDYIETNFSSDREHVINELVDVIQTAWLAMATLGTKPKLDDMFTIPDRGYASTRLLLEIGAAIGSVADGWIGYRGQNPRKGTYGSIADICSALRRSISLSRLAIIRIDDDIPAVTLVRQNYARVLDRVDMTIPTDHVSRISD